MRLGLIGGSLSLLTLLAGGAVAQAAGAPTMPYAKTWTCSSSAPPAAAYQDRLTGKVGGALYVAAADLTRGCVVFYTATGSTWRRTVVSSTPMRGGGASLEAGQFINPRDGWLLVAGMPGAGQMAHVLFHTVNGGATWTQQPLKEQPFPSSDEVVAMRFTSPATGWLDAINDFYGPPRLFVYGTSDGGARWTSTYVALPAADATLGYDRATAPSFTTPLKGTIRVTSSQSRPSLIFATTDGGLHWLLSSH